MFTYHHNVTAKKLCHTIIPVLLLCALLAGTPAGSIFFPDPARAEQENGSSPEIHSFTINHGDGSTSLHEVNLQLEATSSHTSPDQLQVRYANEDRQWTSWETYREERVWMLSGGDGEKTVFVEVKDRDGNVAEASAGITVFVPVSGIVLDWTSLQLVAGGDPVTLIETVLPDHATNRQVTWHSTDPAVADVTNGVVTPLSEGEADIIVTAVDGGYTASCRIEVLSAPPPYDDTIVYGDVTGSGEVDVGDAILILRSIVGEVTLDETQRKAADVNLDGLVDVGDAILVLRYIVGLVPALPVGYTPPEDPGPPGDEDPPPGDEPAPPGPEVMLLNSRLLNAQYRVYPTAQVDVSELNVRSGPGTGQSVIGRVYRGQRFIIREQSQTGDSQYPLWYRINYYGQTGWIAANFVLAMDVLYGLDFWSSPTRLTDAPAGLDPGSYKIDAQYLFHRQDGDNLLPTGITFYFLEQIPYVTMPLDRPTDPQVTAAILEQAVRRVRSDSPLADMAEGFIAAQEIWGVNALYLVAHAALESAWGTSAIARDKQNIFGYMAYDDDPYGHAATFRCMEDCILQVSGFIRRSYLSEGGTWFHGPHLVGMNEKYATDPMWSVKIARAMQNLLNISNYSPVGKELNQGRVTASTLNLRSGPGTGEDIIGTLSEDTTVEIRGMKLAESIPWLKVEAGSAAGWCSSNHVELSTQPRGLVYFTTWYMPGNDTLVLNVRSGPSIDSEVIATLSFTSSFDILELEAVYDNEAKRWYVWYRIAYPGGDGAGVGWIRGDYVIVDW